MKIIVLCTLFQQTNIQNSSHKLDASAVAAAAFLCVCACVCVPLTCMFLSQVCYTIAFCTFAFSYKYSVSLCIDTSYNCLTPFFVVGHHKMATTGFTADHWQVQGTSAADFYILPRDMLRKSTPYNKLLTAVTVKDRVFNHYSG